MSYLSPLPQQLSAVSRSSKTTSYEYATPQNYKSKTPDFDVDEIFKDVKFDTPQQAHRGRPLAPISVSPQPQRPYSSLSNQSPGAGPYTSPSAIGLAPPPTDQPIRNPVRHGVEGEVDALTIRMVNNMLTGEGAAGTPFGQVTMRSSYQTQNNYPYNTYNSGAYAGAPPPPPPPPRPVYNTASSLSPHHVTARLDGDSNWKVAADNCAKCGEGLSLMRPGCTALNQTYHLDCFTCHVCKKRLVGGSFYTVDEKPLCEDDYENTLDKCSVCSRSIKDRILKAGGKPYHPGCFNCSSCGRCLDGVPFTVDANNTTHCVSCFHDKFAPRCAHCHRPIVPEEGKEETLRVVAMDRSYHIDCYRCEDCHLKLSSKVEGHECYPLDGHLLCKQCNSKRLRVLTEAKVEYGRAD
jgi:hypothetical protein